MLKKESINYLVALKRFSHILLVIIILFIIPAIGFAYSGNANINNDNIGIILPLWSILPFAGILLSIALMPLFVPHFWDHHFPKVSAFWALVFAVPFLYLFREIAVHEIAHIIIIDYIPFVLLLGALFTVSGGIYVQGTLKGTPAVNAVILLIGTILASIIGTTGASMLLIRPILRSNSWRVHKVHTIVFFIFLVSNIGGCADAAGRSALVSRLLAWSTIFLDF